MLGSRIGGFLVAIPMSFALGASDVEVLTKNSIASCVAVSHEARLVGKKTAELTVHITVSRTVAECYCKSAAIRYRVETLDDSKTRATVFIGELNTIASQKHAWVSELALNDQRKVFLVIGCSPP